MHKIIDSYLAKTEYGLQLTVKTEDGKWYRQIHLTLEYNGGGIAAWSEIEDPFYTALTNNETI